jgi:hypothetical protein
MNFSFPPPGHGGPVFNFRSEGRSFDESNRRFVSASAFFEFTRQEISKSQAPLLAEGFALHGESQASGEKAVTIIRRLSPCRRQSQDRTSRTITIDTLRCSAAKIGLPGSA